nr:hypothetical protein [Tanacetum cinerariifolium]
LNPLYTIKECSSCGALYTTHYCCSNGSLVDKIICDLNKAPDSPHLHMFSSNQRHCFQCKDVLGDGEFYQQCTCMRCGSGLSKGLCLICGNNQNSLNDSPSISENSSQSPPHINHHCCYECGDPLDGIFCKRCTCKSYGKGAHIGYNCPPKVSVISNPKPCKNQTIDELPQTLPSFHPTYYSGDESPFTCDSTPNIVDDSPNVFNPPPQPSKFSYEICGNDAYNGHDCPPRIPICYDDDEDYTIAITPKEPDNSLSMGDEHLDIIPATESDEFIKYSVENLVPNPSESKIDSLLDKFADELIFLKSIPPGIDKADCDPEEEICLIEKLLYDNSSPRPPEEFIYENSDAIIESFSSSPIPVEDSDPLMEEIDLFLASDGLVPSEIPYGESKVKENQEKDKIGSKPNKNEKRVEAEKSLK